MVSSPVENKERAVMKISRSALHFTGFYLFYMISWPLLRLPLRVLYLLSDLLFLVFYYFPGYRKGVVLENLRNSFPEKSENEIRSISRKFYHHLCDSFIEAFAASGMSREEMERRCVWKNLELLDKYYENGRSLIAVFGHYGNWEWLSVLPLYTKFRVLALYKPLSNIWFDRFIKNLRQKFGLIAVPLIRSYPMMLEYQNINVQTISFFMGDQRPRQRHIKYWTVFLNRKTPVMLGTEQIAKRLDQSVVFFSMRKLRRGYYEVEILDVVDKPRSTEEHEITEQHIRLLENQIRQRPEYWLWTHKRWKHKPEDN